MRDALAAFPADEAGAPNSSQGSAVPAPSAASSFETLNLTGTFPVSPSLHALCIHWFHLFMQQMYLEHL